MKATVIRLAVIAALPALAAGASADDAPAASFTDMVSKGKASLDLRYRYENVDQDSLSRTATANTLRSRLTLSSAAWHGVSVLAEGDNVWDFGSDNYNSTENGKTNRPVIADPTGTDLNQLLLKYSSAELGATGGRQRILHGNQRFVGGVGWRQNEQTYDGGRVEWAPLEGLRVDASYVYNINRIFGPDDGANPADLEGDNYLLRADYQLAEDHAVAAFVYLLDIDADGPYSASQTVNNSSDTYGVEYRGKFKHFSVAAAYANQGEAGDSELDYDADYYSVELGAQVSGLQLQAGWEVLGADEGAGFQTPLATLHAFQGWADQFLTTPGDGVEDLYGGVGAKLGPLQLQAVYHDFQAEDSSEEFGTELDLSVGWPVTERLSLLAKYADFEADSERYTNVEKIWLMAQYRL